MHFLLFLISAIFSLRYAAYVDLPHCILIGNRGESALVRKAFAHATFVRTAFDRTAFDRTAFDRTAFDRTNRRPVGFWKACLSLGCSKFVLNYVPAPHSPRRVAARHVCSGSSSMPSVGCRSW